MIIYLYLIIPPLFLSVESSSIRGRNNKNELVPLISSGVDAPEKGNNLKVVSTEPFIIQLHVPKHNDSKSTREKDKKRKRPGKKRASKLRKKHRTRRDLRTSRLIKRSREEKSQPGEIPIPVNATEVQVNKTTTKNSINRVEILKALSSYSRKRQNKNTEEHEDDAEDNKRTHPFSDKSPIVKMIYPSTPKIDRHSHKYTYKDLMADRKRLEQKINYIKNMFSANDSATDDAVRIRRRTESDKTANKIAKMFLTLSAVNGLRDRRKTRCKDDDEDDEDRVQDVWEKEQRNSPNRKASSSNAERYKVMKWIEFMKNTRSSGKTCPCMASLQDDDSDAFPLEQKLPKDYFLMERSRSSEESSETNRDLYYHSRDRPYRRKYSKDTPENKLKALGKNGKKKLDLPLNDLELYRSRAKQILQNAEEILDKIKEEEERRLSAPNILMSQLKELTSRIQSDPRNNENDLIRKMQKTLGWKPLAKGKEGSDVNTFIDNVKSYILDPYEKAKALTDESAKTLSSYLLRNLGKMQDSSEELEAKQSDDETSDNPQVFFGQVPTKEEEKPLPASLAKEDSQTDLLSKTKEELQNWEDTISTIMQGPEEAVQKIPISTAGDVFKNRMEDIMKEQQKRLDDYEASPRSEDSREAHGDDNPTAKKTKPGIKFTKPEKHTQGGHKHPLRLKPKDGNEKDKTDKLKITPGNHLKGSKVPPPKAQKPEKDTLGGEKHSFRPKPKDGKPVNEIGNHPKHPIHEHLKAHPKDRKTAMPKATESSNEDPEMTASRETDELGKEILEDIVKTLENDENPDSAGEESETGEVREMLETAREEDNEHEVGNPNETPESAGEQPQDGKLEETISGIPKSTNSRQDLPRRPHQSDALPEDGSQSYGKAPDVNSHYPPDYDLLPGDEDETPAKLKEAVGEALEDLSGLTNDETLVQKPETVINAKDAEDKSLEDNLEVIDPLLRKAEQLETELIKTESDLENKSNEGNLQGVIDPLWKKAEQLETEITGEKSELENASAEDNLKDAIDPLLQMAQQLETELDGKENESTEGNVELTNTVSSKEPSKVETQRRDPDSMQAVNEESLENPERTESANKYTPESSQSNEEGEMDPLNLKFERQDAKNRQQAEKQAEELRATLDQQNEEDSSEETGKSESEEDEDSSVKESLKMQESSEERPESDEYAPLKAGKSEGQENMEDSDETPLREVLEIEDDNGDDDDADGSSLGKAVKTENSPVGKALESNEDKEHDEESRSKKGLNNEKEEKYDNPLRKSLGSTDNSDEIPLRKTLESKEEDDVENPLRKASQEQEDKYDTPLSLEKEEQEGDEFPLRKSSVNKDEHGNDGNETPLESEEDEEDEDGNASPLREALKKHPLEMSKGDETALRKTMESKDGVPSVDDGDDRPLRKNMNNKEDEDDGNDDDEAPLRKTLGSKEDEDGDSSADEIPLRKTMRNEDDDDTSAGDNGDETPLRKTMKSKGDENDGDDDDDETTPLRKTTNAKDQQKGDISADDEETPLRNVMKNREGGDVSEDDKDEETPLRNTMKNTDDEDDDDDASSDESGGKIPLRKTLKSTKDRDDDETPLRKTMKNKDEQDVSADDNDETPLTRTMENEDNVSVNDDEIPLRKTTKNQESGDISANDDEGDETPLRKTMKIKENNGDDETPLRETKENKEDEQDGDDAADDDDTPLRKTLGDEESEEDDDETPLRNSDADDETLREENPTEAEDYPPSSKTKPEDRNDPNTQTEGISASEEETPLRETIKQKNEDPDNYRTVTSEENQSEQNELEDPRGETHLQATPNKQNNELDTENSEETPLRGVNYDQDEQDPTQTSAEFKGSTEQDEENLKSVDPTEQQQEDDEGDETSEEVAMNRKDGIHPEIEAESLLKSAEDAEDLEEGVAGDNLRGENPDEQTIEENPLRSSLNDGSFEDAQEKTNEEPSLREEKPGSQNKSAEALRSALETLAEEMENEDEPSLKAEDGQNDDESGDTVKASVSNEEAEPPVGHTVEGSNEEEYLEDADPMKTGTVLDPEERNRNDEFDVTQSSEETPLRVSLNQDHRETGNGGGEDTENPLRNASQENELDSNIQEGPLKTEKTTDDIQEEPNSEETVRAEDTHDQIDGAEDETPLQSARFEESDESTENSLETLREGNPLGEGDTSEETRQRSSLPDLLQTAEKSPKTGKLKLPKSIGQIMKDLGGKAKDDVTSLQNLDPDKIDDIIGKIGEAEQQNLLEHPDVDCRKECACADEIDTRSRNIGRYEIVKDFLHWMKDLQLNRVLTDD